MRYKNRKASLELSIRAIVIVILAMTLLGLGLGFIRTMFKDISGITTDVSEQIRQQILDDLITNDKRVSFPKTQILIDKGGSEIITVGIRNKQDNKLYYDMEFKAISDPDGVPFDIENPPWFQYGRGEGYELTAADSDVRSIRLSIPTGVKAGSYFLTFQVVDVDKPDGENEYVKKDFFIVIRG